MDFEIVRNVGSLIGAIGGVIGFYTFADSYLFAFKPKFNISNVLFFHYEATKHISLIREKSLKSIFVKVDILNDRKKIGRISDYAIRLYDTESTQPSPDVLFVKNILKELPKDEGGVKNIEASPFSSFSVLSKSGVNYIYEFSPEQYNQIIMRPEASLKLDLLYFCPAKGWKRINTYHPHFIKSNGVSNSNFIEYSLLDTSFSRKLVHQKFKKPESAFFKGISGKYLSYYLLKPVHVLRKIVLYPIKILSLILQALKVLLISAYMNFLILPLIRLKSKNISRPQISIGRTDLAQETNKALKKCEKEFEKIVLKINEKTDKNANISIISDGAGFSVKRGSLEIKFYKSGNGYIRIHNTGTYNKNFSFSMRLIKYPLGFYLWKLNGKVMSVKSSCIHVMDHFILLAH